MGHAEFWPAAAAVYHPRKPKDSPLWCLIDGHFADFEQDYEERFTGRYGFYRRVIPDVVGQYLRCGDLQEGAGGPGGGNCRTGRGD